MFKVGLIGYGYWGPNIARNIAAHPQCTLQRICDLKKDRRDVAGCLYPQATLDANPSDLINASDVDIIVIATPVKFHFELACAALNAGKHLWIEKPITSTSEQALELQEIAARKNLKIAVGHTFLFHTAVKKIKELVDSGEIGKVLYYDSVRVNLGLFQTDVNVLWDLAPHEFSILDFIIGRDCQAISATGMGHLNEHNANVGYVTLYYPDNMIAHIHVNWLSPVKMRKTLIGGSKAMIVWDDLLDDEKLKIYDRGIEVETLEGKYNLLASYRMGDMKSPPLAKTEALFSELDHFVRSLKTDTPLVNSVESGIKVIKWLEACDRSIAKRGEPQVLVP